jgi:hypothetical protein
VLDIYSKKKLWEAEKRGYPGIFIIAHTFLGLEKHVIGDAIIQRDVKSIGNHLNNIHVCNLDVLNLLPLNMVLVKNIQASFVLEHFINVRSLQKFRLVMG